MALEAYASRNVDKVCTDFLFEARQSCYKARDAFYSCLEKEANKKPTKIDSVSLLYPVECKPSRDAYEKNCQLSWVRN